MSDFESILAKARKLAALAAGRLQQEGFLLK